MGTTLYIHFKAWLPCNLVCDRKRLIITKCKMLLKWVCVLLTLTVRCHYEYPLFCYLTTRLVVCTLTKSWRLHKTFESILQWPVIVFPIFSKLYLMTIYKSILSTETLNGSPGSLWGKGGKKNVSKNKNSYLKVQNKNMCYVLGNTRHGVWSFE